MSTHGAKLFNEISKALQHDRLGMGGRDLANFLSVAIGSHDSAVCSHYEAAAAAKEASIDERIKIVRGAAEREVAEYIGRMAQQRELLLKLAAYAERVPDDRQNAEHIDRDEIVEEAKAMLGVKVLP